MNVLCLSGGVGGAKLVRGLARVLPPGSLTVVCNTGDDFTHLGLFICPDIDSVTYAVAGLADPQRGWGRSGESWNFMAALRQLGGPDWFALGDGDLALHALRSERLRRGESLSDVTLEIAARLGIGQRILPMSDTPVPTRLDTDCGELSFQDYFVRLRAEPRVRAVAYDGAVSAPLPQRWDTNARFDLIVLAPSNPWLSLGPILAIPAWRKVLAARRGPLIAVSPIVAGAAIKGPTAKLMREFGLEVSALTIARHFVEREDGLRLDGFVLDQADAPLAPQVRALGIECRTAATVMHEDADRDALARAVLESAR